MSSVVNSVVEIGTFGLVDDFTGVEAAQDAANEAAGIQAQGASTAEQGINRRFDITQESLRPFQEAGVGALGQQQALLGLGGQDAQKEAFAAFNESPGQKFIRDRAQRNLTRNASAIGGLGGGNVRSALVEQGAGFAQQDFNNQFGRLGQIAGQGQAATTNIGQFGAQAAQQAGQAGIAGSQARASGILGGQQAESQFRSDLIGLGGAALGAFAGGGGGAAAGSAMSTFSDERLKENIIEVGRDELGGIYKFNYKCDSSNAYKGRMAQELQKTRPDAVSEHESGFLMVTNEFRPELV